VLAFAGCVPIIARGGEVPYVPTPHRVVQEILALASVGPDDVVYDLGAGDRRIVVAAARWRRRSRAVRDRGPVRGGPA
jgi:hypothetical protein